MEVIDECRLCGITKQLSFEHVPPRAADNAATRFRPNTRELIDYRYRGGPAPSVIEERRGCGAYTLCGPCNQRCGRYAVEFIQWARRWRELLSAHPSALLIKAAPWCRRSRVMKQTIAMMLSTSPPGTGRNIEGLRHYVWDATECALPTGVGVYAALTRSMDARQAGGAGKVDLTGGHSVFSEIVFHPLVLVMTMGGSRAPDTRLTDITYFALSRYDERQPTQLELSVLRPRGIYPGAYD